MTLAIGAYSHDLPCSGAGKRSESKVNAIDVLIYVEYIGALGDGLTADI